MKNKKFICVCMVLALSVSMIGCGNKAQAPSQSAKIELVEPVEAESSYELATRRTLYDSAVYSATVVPYLEEYSPEVNINFSKYGAYPGDQVKKGDILIQSDSKAIDERIKEKKDSLQEMQERHIQWKKDATTQLKTLREQADYWKGFVDANDAVKPPEMIDASQVEGSQETGMIHNPAYDEWYAQCGWVIGEYKKADHAYNTEKNNVDYQISLYELDYSFGQKELSRLYQERNEGFVLSGMDGTVVAMGFFDPGNYISKDAKVTAVGDLERKQLKCEYVSKNVIKSASAVYALVNGKQYKVEYQVMETEEYTKLSEENEKVYSTFFLEDAPDVSIGDYGVIVIVKDYRNEVVTVSANSIRKDEAGKFVYLLKDGEYVYTPVKVGMSDGIYAEILEGVSEGDKILSTELRKIGSNRETLSKGEFHTNFDNMGFMYYPYNNYVVNPVENGVTYFVSSELKLNQRVSKGDVIATVRVDRDDIALNRNETKATRLRNRIADLQKKEYEEDSYEARVVADYQKQLTELETEIAKQKKDFQTTQIVADRDGIVIWKEDFKEEDIIDFEQNIIQIADESTCYVVVENKSQLLQYGNTVDIEYVDAANKKQVAKGMVASLSQVAVSKNLQSEYSMILLPKEEIADMIQTSDNSDDWWSRFRYTVKGAVRSMENVVVVPKKAVWESNGKTYVYVIGEDGEPVAHSFVSGGFNDSGYWVVEGLTEGMEVCLE